MKVFIKRNYSTIVLLLIGLFMLFVHVLFTKFALDYLIWFLLLLVIIFKKQETFIKEWALPVGLFYTYFFFRGYGFTIAQYLDRPLLDTVWIEIDKYLFSINGEIPSVYFQYTLSDPLNPIFIPHWYDFVLFIFYTSFFWYWIVVGIVLWLYKRNLLKPYIYGLFIFSIFDSLIYIWYPSAPPWYASELGLLPELRRIMLSYDFLYTKYAEIVSTFESNYFAAFPSHHAAWPFYSTLFLVKGWGKKMIPFFVIPFGIAFATWYGAEHYVIDSLVGFGIAYLSYVLFAGKFSELVLGYNRSLKGKVLLSQTSQSIP